MIKYLLILAGLATSFGYKWVISGAIGVALSVSFAAGFWACSHIKPSAIEFVKAKYKIDDGTNYMTAIKYQGITYYPADGINKWISSKNNLKGVHLNNLWQNYPN